MWFTEWPTKPLESQGGGRRDMLVVASLVVIAACSDDEKAAEGPSAEELTAWAQALDAAGGDLEVQAASYAKVVRSVDKAATKNAAALAKWDKEWKKRQAAYKTEVAAVEAHNASEQAKATPATVEVRR